MSYETKEALFDAATAAAQRSRRVLVLAQLFALMVLIVLANTAGCSVYADRVSNARIGRQLYECAARPAWAGGTGVAHGQGAFCAGARTSELEACSVQWARACQGAGGDEEVRIRAARWIVMLHLSSKDVDAAVARIDDFAKEGVYAIEVPFVGLRIDVNDFGWFGGLAHLYLLAWLAVSFRKEHAILTRIREEGFADLMKDLKSFMFFSPTSEDGHSVYRILLWIVAAVGIWAPVLALVVNTVIEFVQAPTVFDITPMLPSTVRVVVFEITAEVANIAMGILCTINFVRLSLLLNT